MIETPDDERQMIEITRKDNGERVNARPMTEVEKEASRKRRQGDLFPDEANADTEPPPPVNLRSLRGGKPKGKGKKNGKR